jgi:hypothetical protein
LAVVLADATTTAAEAMATLATSTRTLACIERMVPAAPSPRPNR